MPGFFPIILSARDIPCAKIFLLKEIVEVVVSSLTKDPEELFFLFEEFKTVVNELDQSLEDKASPRECLTDASLYLCAFNSKLFFNAV